MKKIILILGLVFSTSLLAQVSGVPVKFDGQIRIRGEVDARDFDNDTDTNTYTLSRIRFGARMAPHEDVDVYVQLQDSRAFGTETNTLASSANIDLHQGYVQVRNFLGKPISIKVGRQEMLYANQRLIGPVGFSNVGRSFDGVKLTFGKQKTFDVFATIIKEGNTAVTGPATPASTAGQENTDYNFWGLYYKYRHNPKYELDGYFLFESDENEVVPGEDNLKRATLGFYSKGQLSERFDFESEAAVQFGNRRGQDVSALMLTGSVGYTFPSVRKYVVRVGYDFLSGMDAADEDYKVFDTLFATNHKFYGFMDYFINIPVNTAGQGLQDFMVKGRIPLSDVWQLDAHFHNFRAAKGEEKNFGTELDLVLNYAYNSAVSFQFALAFFDPGDLMEARFQNSDFGVWSYTTLLVGF